MTAATCPHCATSYTGLRACHCSRCHATFVGGTAFDRHLFDGGARCATDVEMTDLGMEVDERGRWFEAEKRARVRAYWRRQSETGRPEVDYGAAL